MTRRALDARICASVVALIVLLSATTLTTEAAVTLSSFSGRALVEASSSRIVLTWTTASEINSAGFNLYRSARREGPYTRINIQLIPAADDALTGGTYQYVDANVRPGQTFFYQLEDVELNGTSARHPPIVVTVSETQAGFEMLIFAGAGIGALALIAGGIYLVRRKSRR